MSVAVVDLLDDSPPRSHVRPPPSAEELKAALEGHLVGKDLAGLSLKTLRRDLEQRLGVGDGGLDTRREEIKQLAQAFAQAQLAQAQLVPPAPAAALAPAARPPEAPAAKRRKLFSAPAAPSTGHPAATAPLDAVSSAVPVGVAPKVDAPAAAKRGPSAYAIWSAEHRPRISSELASAKAGAKPSLSEMAKALAEAWRGVPAADRAPYEQKAALAKQEAAKAEPVAPK
eukprot:CAMPEP_0176085178 /NCGR_PEP_ID=MMETSP0120_2-20121206/42630_1 /TAXON_ID=160619 /ORGANISM="Kryptoperidinium foliaceum, Strain CCMP 1326" /LENGTH=227 /DNA_ID=CAMNT_0017418993 /DNA_START=12 /DNA_END=692 /DNA_ORIENTATION=+